MAKITPKQVQPPRRQNYPRIEDDQSPLFDYLDDSAIAAPTEMLSVEVVKSCIRRAISDANTKSRRSALSEFDFALLTEAERIRRTRKTGQELLKYFRNYSPDPAETAHQVHGKHYLDVGRDLFHRRTLQNGRMNSGWRYQYLASGCAQKSGRFTSVSNLSAGSGADFSAVIPILNRDQPLNIFVSVKNRKNTIGGQDFPKAVETLEKTARDEKNKIGPYLCVFGVAMDRGLRQRRRDKHKQLFSENTEVWLSDYFWPFFTNYSYEDIMTLVLEVLEEVDSANDLPTLLDVPDTILESFGEQCRRANLVDTDGIFSDARRIVNFICAG